MDAPQTIDAPAQEAPPPLAEKKPDKAEAYAKWFKRFDAAEPILKKECDSVWKPLYDGLIGSLLRGEADADPINGFAQFGSMIMPHLVGDTRQATVSVTRINAGENPAEKIAFAEMMGDQATAITKATGFYVDEFGRPGEFVKALWDSLYGVGILLFGFEVRKGVRAVPDAGAGDIAQEVDLDRASADNAEKSDAGMPWVRAYSPERVLFDYTYNDIAKGAWVRFESYMTLRAVRERWPQYKDDWKKTHGSVGAKDESGGDDVGDEDGLVRIFHVYARDPVRLLLIPDKGSGVNEIIEERPLKLGIEGLPIVTIGTTWLPSLGERKRPYPKPALAEVLGPAQTEIDHQKVVRAMVRKIKTLLLVGDDDLAEAIRNGDPNGVTTVPERLRSLGLENLIHTKQVGGVPKEHIDLADRNRQNLEQNSGLSNMNLGLREPGDQTATESANRAAAISVRQQGIVQPARLAEAAAHQRILSIAYENLDLMHGMQFPVDGGASLRFAGLDVNKPMIGEMIDFGFDVQVSNAATRADDATAATQAANALMGMEQFVNAQGKMTRYDILAEAIARGSGIRQANELVVEIPPQPPAPEQSGASQYGADPNADPNAAPAQGDPSQQQQPDPMAELEQLYAMLEQAGEGSPEEEQIMQEIAARTAAMEGAAV